MKIRPYLGRIKRFLLRIKPQVYSSGTFNQYLKVAQSPNWVVDESLNERFINIVLPGLNIKNMSGGPNTAINLFCRLLRENIPLRFIAINSPTLDSREKILSHFHAISGISLDQLQKIELLDAYNKHEKIRIGPNDLFVGTAWWTVQSFKNILSKLQEKRFIYLIQDYETNLYPWGLHYAMALETYSLPHIPIVNSTSLLEHLVKTQTGIFANKDILQKAICFMPSVDFKHFYFDRSNHATTNKKKLKILFYARPQTATRNLFEMATEAIYQCYKKGLLTKENCEIYFMGELIPKLHMGNMTITCLPWMTYAEYGRQMRSSDIVISLMLSPHPSYTPLEAAACGAITLTNSYFSRTSAYMESLSANIVCAEPNINSLVLGLEKSIRLSQNILHREKESYVKIPKTWDEAFENSLRRVLQFIRGLDEKNSF